MTPTHHFALKAIAEQIGCDADLAALGFSSHGTFGAQRAADGAFIRGDDGFYRSWLWRDAAGALLVVHDGGNSAAYVHGRINLPDAVARVAAIRPLMEKALDDVNRAGGRFVLHEGRLAEGVVGLSIGAHHHLVPALDIEGGIGWYLLLRPNDIACGADHGLPTFVASAAEAVSAAILAITQLARAA